jgi:hypothetical protein
MGGALEVIVMRNPKEVLANTHSDMRRAATYISSIMSDFHSVSIFERVMLYKE